MEEPDRPKSACIYHLFRHRAGATRERVVALGAAGRRLLLHCARTPRVRLRPPQNGRVADLRGRASPRRGAGGGRAAAGIGGRGGGGGRRFLRRRPGRGVEADGDGLPRRGLQLELGGGEREEGAVARVLVVVGDRVQWRVAVVLLLHLLRGRAVHVVLVGASIVVSAAKEGGGNQTYERNGHEKIQLFVWLQTFLQICLCITVRPNWMRRKEESQRRLANKGGFFARQGRFLRARADAEFLSFFQEQTRTKRNKTERCSSVRTWGSWCC